MMSAWAAATTALLLAVASAAAVDQCQPHAVRPWWPTYHIVGNVTRNADGSLPVKPAHINDANAIFQYKQVFHVMHQSARTWGHLTSTDLVHWTRRGKVFAPPPKNSSWDREAECDGSLSFPAGLGPRIMWTPDCDNKAASSRSQLGLGGSTQDFAHLAVAEPADSADPLLLDWNKDSNNPATGDIPSFPDSVWKSEVGTHYNLLGALNGSSPWARYTSDSKLLVWKLADPAFATWVNATVGDACEKCCSYRRRPAKAAGGVSAPQWNAIPGAAPGGPTHMINMARGNAFALGRYDAQAEHMTLDGCRVLAEGAEYAWTATGADASGRRLSIAWLWPQTYVLPESSACVEALSMVRELRWDAPAGTLIAAPVPEYASLRNATLLAEPRLAVAAGAWSSALSLADPTAGATSEIALTLTIGDGATALGVAVLAPSSSADAATSAVVWLNVTASSSGSGGGMRRDASLTLATHHAPPQSGVAAMEVVTHHFTLGAGERKIPLQIFVDRVIIE
eukprot:COSAG01_NODE_8379_length_2807_cov_12.130355_2_plen_510_part_00